MSMRPSINMPWWLRIRLVEILDAWCMRDLPGHEWLWSLRVRLLKPMTIERARRMIDCMLRVSHVAHPLPRFRHPIQPGAGALAAVTPGAACVTVTGASATGSGR